jgi:hypothetical protein
VKCLFLERKVKGQQRPGFYDFFLENKTFCSESFLSIFYNPFLFEKVFSFHFLLVKVVSRIFKLRMTQRFILKWRQELFDFSSFRKYSRFKKILFNFAFCRSMNWNFESTCIILVTSLPFLGVNQKINSISISLLRFNNFRGHSNNIWHSKGGGGRFNRVILDTSRGRYWSGISANIVSDKILIMTYYNF